MNYILWFIGLIVLGYGTIVSAGVAWGIAFLWLCRMVKGWVVVFWAVIFLGAGSSTIYTIIHHPF